MRSLRACLPILLLVLAPPPAHAAESEVFLSWHAPWGRPGASSTLVRPCIDTTRVDTLYLSVRSGRSSPGVFAFSADLWFHPGSTDSLGPFWKRGYYPERPTFLRVECPSDSADGSHSPFAAPTFGDFTWDYTTMRARLRMVYAVPSTMAKPADGDAIYTLARVLLGRPPVRFSMCDQPVCVEVFQVGLTLGLKEPTRNVSVGDHRFAAINSPDERVCLPYQAVAPSFAADSLRPAAADSTR